MEPRERVIKAFMHIQPDKVPFFELGIDEKIAGKLMGRDIFLYDRTYNLKHKLFEDYKEYNRINKLFAVGSIKNTCDLYSSLDMDIIPVRIYSSFISPFSSIYMGLTDSFDNIKLSRDVLSEDAEVWKIEDSEGFWSKLNFNKKNNIIFMQSDSIYEGGIEELSRFNKHARKRLDNLKTKSFSPTVSNEKKPAENKTNHTHSVSDLYAIFPEQIRVSLACTEFALTYESTRDRFILGYGSLCFPTNAAFDPLFLEAMIVYPDVAYDFLELTTEGIIPIIEAQLKLGVDGIICVNDYAYNSGPVFSPQHFKKFLVPFYKRIVDLCHSYGKPFIKHCDGNITSLLDMFVHDCNFDGIHAIEPSADMNIYELKKKYGKEVTLIGNLDCSGLLVNGSKQEIEDEVLKLKKILSPAGGYIFSSSNSIHSGVKFENFNIMLDKFREIRNYE